MYTVYTCENTNEELLECFTDVIGTRNHAHPTLYQTGLLIWGDVLHLI